MGAPSSKIESIQDSRYQSPVLSHEMRYRQASGPASNPKKRANIALDLKEMIGIEQGSNSGRILAAPDPLQYLLCNSNVLLTAHLVSPFGVAAESHNLLMPRARATIRR